MKRLSSLTSAVLVSALLAGCAALSTNAYDSAIHGRIVDRSEQDVVVDVGSADHVSVGAQLDVLHQTLVGNPKQMPYYVDSSVGVLRVDAILSPHRARATLISGKSSRGDLVGTPRAS